MMHKRLEELAIDTISGINYRDRSHIKGILDKSYKVNSNSPCVSIQENIYGPDSRFILYLDAKDRISYEGAVTKAILIPIMHELSHNIQKQYQKMQKEQQLSLFLPFISFIGLRKSREKYEEHGVKKENEFYIFDFADTGLGIPNTKIAALQGKALLADTQLSNKLPEEIQKELIRMTVESDVTEETGGMGLTMAYRTCKTSKGIFYIAYDFRENGNGRNCALFTSLNPTHIRKTNRKPIKKIDNFLENRTKTHVRVFIPTDYVLTIEKYLIENSETFQILDSKQKLEFLKDQ